MLFDFDKFADITASVFPGGPYTLDEALGVFRYYFEQYEAHTGRPHPPMIDQHFQTRYRRCDYNINHFFSGRIRELRFYETCY